MTADASEIFVALPNWIGDVVMATPMIRALRKRFPAPHRLVGVMRPYVAAILEGTSWFDETLLFERGSKNRVRGFWQLTQTLRQRRPDTMIILPSSLGFGLAAWLAGVKYRIAYTNNLRGWTLTKGLTPLGRRDTVGQRSVVDHYLELAYSVGCEVESPHPELVVLPEYVAAADVVFSNLGIDASQSVLAINPGTGNGSARNWPTERFVELARRLVQQSPHNVVLVLCGPKERGLAESIATQANHPRVRSMAEQDMRLGVTNACLLRSRMLLTPDSGLRHVAAAFDVPVVCLSGPIDPEWTYSYNPHEVHIRVDLPCSPCGKLNCPLGHNRCMTDLTTDNVEMAVQERLVRIEKKSA